jgi:hemerythrin-like metal-binding protein
VLIEVGRRWLACVREGDTVARIGGDEFAVVVGGLQAADNIAALAEKIIAALALPIELPGNQQCLVGVSVGICLYPSDATEIDSILSRADTAMYEAKRHGKNTFTFYSTVASPDTVGSDWIVFTAADLVGIAIMDEQHRKIAHLLNKINQAITAQGDDFTIKTLFDELIAYTVFHFETEHKLMVKHGYTDCKTHDSEHERLTQEVLTLQAKLRQGSELLTLQTLKDWLVGHIHLSDRKLGKFLASVGVH